MMSYPSQVRKLSFREGKLLGQDYTTSMQQNPALRASLFKSKAPSLFKIAGYALLFPLKACVIQPIIYKMFL